MIEYSIIQMADTSTREEILVAAGEVLARDGYDGFTTKAIAEEADVSQGLVHHYFGTKQKLLLELFEWGSEDVETEVVDRLDTDDPREQLVALADYMINGGDTFSEAVDVGRLGLELRHRAIHDDDIRTLLDEEQSRIPGLVADIVTRGIEVNRFRAVDPQAFADVYLATIQIGEQRRGIFAAPEACHPIYESVVTVIDQLLVKSTEGPTDA